MNASIPKYSILISKLSILNVPIPISIPQYRYRDIIPKYSQARTDHHKHRESSRLVKLSILIVQRQYGLSTWGVDSFVNYATNMDFWDKRLYSTDLLVVAQVLVVSRKITCFSNFYMRKTLPRSQIPYVRGNAELRMKSEIHRVNSASQPVVQPANNCHFHIFTNSLRCCIVQVAYTLPTPLQLTELSARVLFFF